MTDRLTQQQRSTNMSRIRGRDTHPEIVVSSVLRRLGFRFRLHAPDLPGRPDIALPRRKTVVFIHGCFWHRHPGCKYAYMPKSRVKFWKTKFEANMLRDRTVARQLRNRGWHVIVVWECRTEDRQALATRLSNLLSTRESGRLRSLQSICARITGARSIPSRLGHKPIKLVRKHRKNRKGLR